MEELLFNNLFIDLAQIRLWLQKHRGSGKPDLETGHSGLKREKLPLAILHSGGKKEKKKKII